jgi:KUP system potassium uptake protein
MVYQEFLLKFEAQQEVHVFLHLRALSKPHVSEEERYAVSRTTLANCYRITIRHGYNDRVISADLGDIVYQELRHAIMAFPAMPALSTQDSEGTPPASSAVSTSIEHVASSQDSSSSYKLQFSVPNDASVERRLAKLDTAYKRQVVYIVGKEQLRLLSENNNFVKRLVLYVFVWLRENTRAKISQMEVPIEKLVEVGFVKDM